MVVKNVIPANDAVIENISEQDVNEDSEFLLIFLQQILMEIY